MTPNALNKLLLNFFIPVICLVVLSFILKPIVIIPLVLIFILFTFTKNTVEIYTFLGSVNYNKGDLKSSLYWLKKACASKKAKPKNHITHAYVLLKSGEVDPAEAILNKLLSSKLDSETEMLAKSNLALILWKKGSLDEAIAMLEEVMQNYKTTTIYGSLGYMLILKGDLDKALGFNLQAYEYNNSNTIIVDNLGHTYFLKGEYEKAKEIYERLMTLNPFYPEAYYNFGLLLEKLGEPERAVKVMERALNYKTSFLSAVSLEDIKAKIEELKKGIPTLAPSQDG